MRRASCALRRRSGHIQFHDVMRQRLEHVQTAMVEMQGHLQDLGIRMGDGQWNGEMERTFARLLEGHLQTYRMASQTETHVSVAGGQSGDHSRPAIELF